MLQALVDARLLRRQVASLSAKNSQPSSDDHGAGESDPNVLLPGKLTWNRKIEVWKMIFPFQLDDFQVPMLIFQETNISPKNGILKMIFLFPRWDMLIFQGVLFCNPFRKDVFPLFFS